MHNIELVLILAAEFSAALVRGYLTHRLGWPPIGGYLVAGTLVGPQTPGFVANRHMAEQLAGNASSFNVATIAVQMLAPALFESR